VCVVNFCGQMVEYAVEQCAGTFDNGHSYGRISW